MLELAGVEIPREEMQRILAVLGFEVSGDGDSWDVAIPTWRSDIVHEACIVEEIIRINGFDSIPVTPLPRDTTLPRQALTENQKRRSIARRMLAARGMVEAVTYSFMDDKEAALFTEIDDGTRIVNPISSELSIMRPTPLGNLIRAAGRNADRGFANADLFEVGPEFHGDGIDDQRIVAAGIRTGLALPKQWSGAARQVDAFMAKADAMAVLGSIGAPVDKLRSSRKFRVTITQGVPVSYAWVRKTHWRVLGEINPRVLNALGVKGPVVAFEIYPDAVPAPKKNQQLDRWSNYQRSSRLIGILRL